MELRRLFPLTQIQPPNTATREAFTNPFAQTEQTLQQARQYVSTNEWDVAFQLLTQAEDHLRKLQQSAWNYVLATTESPAGNPLTLGVSSVPEFFVVEQQLRNSNWSANLLKAGNMEALQQVQSAGWQHHRHPQHSVQSLVELTPHFPREGSSSLRLQAWSSDASSTPSFLEAPVWITSPAISVNQGDVLHIRGWINITEPLQHHGDGLVVYDSIGGITMADRFHHTTGWQPFSLIRVAPTDGTIQVNFALMGLGEVSIDNVSIQKQILQTPPPSPIQLNASGETFQTSSPATP